MVFALALMVLQNHSLLGLSGSDLGCELPPLESWTIFFFFSSDALKVPEQFLSTQLLSTQLSAKFLVQFRVMLIYRACLGAITYIPHQLIVDPYSRK